MVLCGGGMVSEVSVCVCETYVKGIVCGMGVVVGWG